MSAEITPIHRQASSSSMDEKHLAVEETVKATTTFEETDMLVYLV